MLALADTALSAILDPLFLPANAQGKPPDFYGRQVELIHSFSLEDLQHEQERIRTLFFDILSHCDYDRSKIAPKSPLELILDPEVYAAHDLAEVDAVTGRNIRETMAEALFAARLGVKPEPADSDYHTVYYLLDRSQERLGVFKVRIDKPARQDRYGASEDREAHLAEAANWQLDDCLHTGLVPHTEVVTCDFPLAASLTGSFQFYVPNAVFLETELEGDQFFDPDHSALRTRLDVPGNRALSLPNFEEFALFDLLTANNDHHFRNILRKNTGGLIAIDNGNSFPWCHDQDLPAYKLHPLHWFKWRALPHAKQPFSKRLVDKINQIDLDSIEALLRRQLVSDDVPSSIEHIDGKIKTLRERFFALKQLANQTVSIEDIANAILQLSEAPVPRYWLDRIFAVCSISQKRCAAAAAAPL